MLPVSTGNDVSYCCYGNADFVSNSLQGYSSSGILGTNCNDDLFGQDSLAATFSLCLPVLFYFVSLIFFRAAEKQMVPMAASAYIAFVTYALAMRNAAVEKKIGESMRQDRPSVSVSYIKPAVSIHAARTIPQEASIGVRFLRYGMQESFDEWTSPAFDGAKSSRSYSMFLNEKVGFASLARNGDFRRISLHGGLPFVRCEA